MLSRGVLLRSISGLKLPPSLQRWFHWYPRRGGEFLGDMLAGHNLFIADIPRKFDAQHARHFSLVESLCITPLFTLTMVHYFSSFFLHPKRWQMIPVLMTELARKTETQQQWMSVMEKKSPTDVVVWRASMSLMQIVLFPACLLLSSLTPQMMHAMLERTNHIVHQKLACINKDAPPFVQKYMDEAREAEAFHSQQLCITTDYLAALLIVLLVLYLTS
ncbi:hypothetical protein C3747_90g160 [Trypanosoma cruzi]|uniref:Uncharacterized protein n=2 Tax=Trypanosoma cruzi TaxID=5693 RepID=Q4DGV5_TRYCC|nr:hypothetical protein, conserved [Trypanosoma cruzi]EAN91750.1 hypothetical protein, conserved [Trypanosoma cruzi]PWV08403.1 hypothetical protein C3747_90g160 [Trypanosoma cruzi]RNC52380.1 hypothetical protein TcCL_ESM10401 [Trypanosoma cruzi]|eukprot:XP_813601.1 hypothetical protein [Trypanosoma cruzi strain CL Brener]